MNRRNALKTLSLGMGYTLSAASLSTLMVACREEAKLTWTPAFFNPTEAGVIEKMVDVMLPATNTPGAKDVGVPQLIDLLLNDVYKVEDQEKFRNGMTSFFAEIGDESALKKATTEKVEEILKAHLSGLPEAEKSRVSALGQNEAPENAEAKAEYDRYRFLFTLRQMAISGYFSSQEIGMNHLNYDPVPGPYQGCIPAADVGTTWAL